jgi:hypothetical protein
VAYLTVDGVNAFLAATKYDVAEIEEDLEQHVVDAGFAIVAARYATEDWTDKDLTPSLVFTALCMIYAAWFLQRQIGDDQDEQEGFSYQVRLEQRGMAILKAIADGTYDLPGVEPDPDLVNAGVPLFFPTDASTTLAEEDPFDPDGSPRAFSMGTRF